MSAHEMRLETVMPKASLPDMVKERCSSQSGDEGVIEDLAG